MERNICLNLPWFKLGRMWVATRIVVLQSLFNIARKTGVKAIRKIDAIQNINEITRGHGQQINHRILVRQFGRAEPKLAKR